MSPDFSDPIFTARAAPARRVIGVGILVLLGILLINVGMAAPNPALFARASLILLGALALAAAVHQWRVSQTVLVLREDGIFEQDGTPVAPLDHIAKVDRALFSFKPSNGFLIRLKTPQPRSWKPGVWWRFGTRVGIGGLMPGAQMKIFADTLSAMIAERDGA